MLVNLTRCMRYWDDLSATQLLARRMGHLEKGRIAESHSQRFRSNWVFREVTPISHSNLKTYRTDYRERCWKTIIRRVDPVECY